ncbi:LON domain serine protease [Melampsora larici-populina 98AG31]|uniref:Lon protease homolog, mitochondrial n=1 Tax=Melampsora larici-populina (strain 98AG31 / pathotype 3-4-7) TaxID=747676 RepID=F4RM49_MELLP|nr:LON domain serine protease [Melampsora larici-populina 98AG31]EGG06532.1 LON domain serine protease [Melampsora larici-populina 98AG31]
MLSTSLRLREQLHFKKSKINRLPSTYLNKHSQQLRPIQLNSGASSSSSSSPSPHRQFSISSNHQFTQSDSILYPRLNPKWINHRSKHTSDDKSQPKPSDQNEENDDDPTRIPKPQSPAHESDINKSNSNRSNQASTSSTSSATNGSLPPNGASSSDDPPSNRSSQKPTLTTSLSKQAVPELYPQLLALPITRRPLFPGFYKAVIVKNPAVIKVIQEMMRRGQPYLGAFLLRDNDLETDIISDPKSVHEVGVFAQITSIFPTHPNPNHQNQNRRDPTLKKDEDEFAEGLTAVLYPHRRIRINEVLAPIIDPNDVAKFKEASKLIEEEEGEEGSTKSDDPNLQSTQVLQTAFLKEHPVSLVNVENLTLQPSDPHSQLVRAIGAEIISVLKEIATLNPLFRDQVANFSVSQGAGNVFEDADKLADFAAAVSTTGPSIDSEAGTNQLQEVLESVILEDRLQKALLVLKQELKNAELQTKIAREVESRITKRQREFYLLEQLKGIKKELGIEGDGKEKLLEKFREKALGLKMPEYARTVFEEEINKLQTLEPQASEFNVTRNYLDWLTQIPWGRHSEENFGLKNAIQVLDEDHYGLKDVKDRILEFLAVGKLRGTVEGKILCLVGPPGVGKTSIGKSIARALDRQFFRFSVGGLTDVAEIKGHRRTYVGAMPGKLIQALKKVQTENPLVLIDEIDKVGKGHNGDPASALLEMLDPEQNSSFLDHYIDIPVDLSRVLFVCTANNLDTIPAPLLDRMEVMEVSGYVTDEKINIATRYLAPQAKKSCGLENSDVMIEEEAIASLIKSYCRESGVRKLKQNIDKVFRKAALKIVQDLGEVEEKVKSEEKVQGDEGRVKDEAAENTTNPQTDHSRKTTTTIREPLKLPKDLTVRITSNTLKDYLGPPIYQKERFYHGFAPLGVSQGLGYTGNGSGSVLSIENRLIPTSSSNGTLTLTGKLGEVIKESAMIALSFVKSNAFSLGLVDDAKKDLLENRSIHLHLPEGGIGKDGPSAGIAIFVGFIGLFSGLRLRSDLAMTGEMTLAGQVLPVGGLKEKILAAHRSGIKKILAPIGNQADIEFNVPDSVKEGIEIVYVEDLRDVLREAFMGEEKIISKLDKLEHLGDRGSQTTTITTTTDTTINATTHQ